MGSLNSKMVTVATLRNHAVTHTRTTPFLEGRRRTIAFSPCGTLVLRILLPTCPAEKREYLWKMRCSPWRRLVHVGCGEEIEKVDCLSLWQYPLHSSIATSTASHPVVAQKRRYAPYFYESFALPPSHGCLAAWNPFVLNTWTRFRGMRLPWQAPDPKR